MGVNRARGRDKGGEARLECCVGQLVNLARPACLGPIRFLKDRPTLSERAALMRGAGKQRGQLQVLLGRGKGAHGVPRRQLVDLNQAGEKKRRGMRT